MVVDDCEPIRTAITRKLCAQSITMIESNSLNMHNLKYYEVIRRDLDVMMAGG